MTPEEFKKTISKSYRFDNYFYNFFALALIGVGIFLFYDFCVNPNKYQWGNGLFIQFFVPLIPIFMGGLSMYLLSNRYKILPFKSTLPGAKKKQVIEMVTRELKYPFIDSSNQFWFITYFGKWWESSFNVYLAFNNTEILACVVAKTGGGGFIGLGSTERFRRKLTNLIIEELGKQ